MHPNLATADMMQQWVFISKGMRDEQLAHQRRRIASDAELVAALEQGLAEGGYQEGQRRVAELWAARYEMPSGAWDDYLVPRSIMPLVIALRYRDAGDYDRAIDWLEEGYEVRDRGLPYISSPLYDPLRSDPRFQDLLRRMNLPTTPAGSDPGEQR
jgi:hypothetical protein